MRYRILTKDHFLDLGRSIRVFLTRDSTAYPDQFNLPATACKMTKALDEL
jgi:hypothetical protein